jgi:hypothetical protein
LCYALAELSGNDALTNNPDQGPNKLSMTLKIERTEREGSTVFVLSGRFEAEHTEELERLLKREQDGAALVLDLKEVRLADRGAVQFLAQIESVPVRLVNCPAYIREWVSKEKKG